MALFNATKKGSATYCYLFHRSEPLWYLVIAKSYLILGKKRRQPQLWFISLLYSFYVAGMKILNMIFLLNTSKQSIEVQSLISNSARISYYSKGFRRQFARKTTFISVWTKQMENTIILKPINSTRKPTLLNLS